MGTQAGLAPGFFAFERWVLGWIDDNQVKCHQSGVTTVELSAIEKIGGTKAIITPIDSTSALVVESRRKIGFDKNTPEGALVYVVNTALPGGSGPIKVRPNCKSELKYLKDAPLTKGDTYTYENIIVEVLESKKETDSIIVTIK